MESNHPSRREASFALNRVPLFLDPLLRLRRELGPCKCPLSTLRSRLVSALQAGVSNVPNEAGRDAFFLEEASDSEAIKRVLAYAEDEGLERANEEIGVEGGGDGAVGVLEEAEFREESRGGGCDVAADEVRVS
jgi:hypothetical protein